MIFICIYIYIYAHYHGDGHIFIQEQDRVLRWLFFIYCVLAPSHAALIHRKARKQCNTQFLFIYFGNLQAIHSVLNYVHVEYAIRCGLLLHVCVCVCVLCLEGTTTWDLKFTWKIDSGFGVVKIVYGHYHVNISRGQNSSIRSIQKQYIWQFRVLGWELD